MEKAPITLMTIDGIRFWMHDQSDHAIFIRRDPTAEYVSKADKAWDCLLKVQELEVSQ